jgi:hypothetical protein
LKNEE